MAGAGLKVFGFCHGYFAEWVYPNLLEECGESNILHPTGA